MIIPNNSGVKHA